MTTSRTGRPAWLTNGYSSPFANVIAPTTMGAPAGASSMLSTVSWGSGFSQTHRNQALDEPDVCSANRYPASPHLPLNRGTLAS